MKEQLIKEIEKKQTSNYKFDEIWQLFLIIPLAFMMLCVSLFFLYDISSKIITNFTLLNYLEALGVILFFIIDYFVACWILQLDNKQEIENLQKQLIEMEEVKIN